MDVASTRQRALAARTEAERGERYIGRGEGGMNAYPRVGVGW